MINIDYVVNSESKKLYNALCSQKQIRGSNLKNVIVNVIRACFCVECA